MTTSSADPDDILKFLQPYTASNSAWTAANVEDTASIADYRYAESLNTASDAGWAPSVAASYYTTTSSSTMRTKSSTFDSVPRSVSSNTTAPSLVQAQAMVGVNPAPVASTGAGHGERFALWCEFRDILGCYAEFSGDNEYLWIQHHVGHIGEEFPPELVCWFCDDHPFKAKHSAERRAMFDLRMEHICEHIRSDYFTVDDMRPDFRLFEYMYRHGSLDKQTFEGLGAYSELPVQYHLPSDVYEYPSYAQADSGQVYNQAQEDRRWRKEQSKRRHK